MPPLFGCSCDHHHWWRYYAGYYFGSRYHGDLLFQPHKNSEDILFSAGDPDANSSVAELKLYKVGLASFGLIYLSYHLDPTLNDS